MKRENEPENGTGAPYENCFSKAEWKFRLVRVPRQVGVPERIVPAEAVEGGGLLLAFFLLHLKSKNNWTCSSLHYLFTSRCKISDLLHHEMRARHGKYSHYVWELSYVYNDCWHTDQLFWVCLFLHHGDFWKGDNRRWLERSLCLCFKIGTMISSSSRRTCNLHWRSWMIRLQRLHFSLYETSLARDCKETRCVII